VAEPALEVQDAAFINLGLLGRILDDALPRDDLLHLDTFEGFVLERSVHGLR
jgi:hypothetical protein